MLTKAVLFCCCLTFFKEIEVFAAPPTERSCRTDQITSEYNCPYGFILPDTFNVSNLPSSIRSLNIGSNVGFTVLMENFVPVPPQQHINRVTLNSFVFHNGTDLPVNDLLVHVRGNVVQLSIIGGTLRHLSAAVLRGFNKLEVLELRETGLKGISKNSFQECGEQPLQWGWRPSLKTFLTSGNFFDSLDWSVFATVSRSMERVEISNSSVESLYLSEQFSFQRISNITLSGNRLKNVSSEILTTVANTQTAQMPAVDLRNNNFCSSDKLCRCCEMADLMRWIASKFLRQRPGTSQIYLTCGSGPACGSFNNPSDWYYAKCSENFNSYNRFLEPSSHLKEYDSCEPPPSDSAMQQAN